MARSLGSSASHGGVVCLVLLLLVSCVAALDDTRPGVEFPGSECRSHYSVPRQPHATKERLTHREPPLASKQLRKQDYADRFRFKPKSISQTSVNQIYKLFKIAIEALQKCKIKWWADGGTLLGAVRHEGLMQWDDDIDIGMEISDEQIYINHCVKAFKAGGLESLRWYYGYKVFPPNGKAIPGKPFKFPFIDVFLTDWRGDPRSKTPSKCGDSYYPRSDLWPSCYFKGHELFPLGECKYGPLKIPCANKPEPYFERCYGKKWKVEAYKGKDHETYGGPDRGAAEVLTKEMMKPAMPE